MDRRTADLPTRFPIGTKYVLESRGPFVRRYVEFPDGRRVELSTRLAQSCVCTGRKIIVPMLRVAAPRCMRAGAEARLAPL